MNAILCFLAWLLLQTEPMPGEVQQLINTLTPAAVGYVRPGMAYKVSESRMSEKRLEAINRLGTMGDGAAAAVPILTQLFADRYEPRAFKFAAIHSLQKIGPAASQSVNALRQVQGSKDLLLSTAAECAIHHIQARPEERALRESFDHRFALLSVLSSRYDEQLLALVNSYIRQSAAQQTNKTFGEIESIAIKLKRPGVFIAELLNNPVGQELGHRLLNASSIDGKSLTRQFLISGGMHQHAGILFDDLNEREIVARQIIEDGSVPTSVWEEVFRKYVSLIAGRNQDDQQKQLLETVTWLRGISPCPDRCAELVLEWLMEFWADSNTSEGLRSEIIDTSRSIVACISDDEAIHFIQFCTGNSTSRLRVNWEFKNGVPLEFAVQLIPDSRASKTERKRIVQVLSDQKRKGSPDPLATEVIMLRLMRWQPASEPVVELPPSMIEQLLLDGQFAHGETALLRALDANPMDDEVRFGLGAIQFVRAVENLGKGFYEYGEVAANSHNPFPRLPVPQNPTLSTRSYQAVGRMLDLFVADLSRAEATLALISDDNVKLRLRLAKITFDFSGTGKNQTTLLDLLAKLNGGRFLFEIANPEFRIQFDRADVAWLRAYCHLLCAMVDGYRAIGSDAEFAQRVASIFPKAESVSETTNANANVAWFQLKIADPTPLHRMRLHLLAVCKLNSETWIRIRSETDDDYEWLSHPKQTDQLSLPITDDRIDRCLELMEQLEGLLEGEVLISPLMLGPAAEIYAEKALALNLRKVLDDPPVDLLNFQHLIEVGIDEKYFELAKNKKEFATTAAAVLGLLRQFRGPFDFAYAACPN